MQLKIQPNVIQKSKIKLQGIEINMKLEGRKGVDRRSANKNKKLEMQKLESKSIEEVNKHKLI